MSQIKTHPKMLDEILESINSSDNIILELKKNYDSESYFRGYMELLTSDKWSTLDVKEVVFKQYDYHRSMAGAMLLNRQTWNIMSSIIMTEYVPNRTKAIQYKALSEMLYVGESKVLTAILEKNLEIIYPNITFAKIVDSLEVENVSI